MTRYLTRSEVLEMHRRILDESGGSPGVRDLGSLESAVAQPQVTFNQVELYERVVDKAAALGFSLILNHPFMDGNKRTGHAALETFLVLNGYQLDASVDEMEQVILKLAAGGMTRAQFTDWLDAHIIPI